MRGFASLVLLLLGFGCSSNPTAPLSTMPADTGVAMMRDTGTPPVVDTGPPPQDTAPPQDTGPPVGLGGDPRACPNVTGDAETLAAARTVTGAFDVLINGAPSGQWAVAFYQTDDLPQAPNLVGCVSDGVNAGIVSVNMNLALTRLPVSSDLSLASQDGVPMPGIRDPSHISSITWNGSVASLVAPLTLHSYDPATGQSAATINVSAPLGNVTINWALTAAPSM